MLSTGERLDMKDEHQKLMFLQMMRSGHHLPPRPLGELNDILCELIFERQRLLDKVFRAFDRKGAGRFLKDQLNIILQKCDVYITPEELELLWKSLPRSADDLCNFGGFIKHFQEVKKIKENPALSDFYYIAPDHDELKETDNTALSKKVIEKIVKRMEKAEADYYQNLTPERRFKNAMERIEPVVLNEWERVKDLFTSADRIGYATVSIGEARNIFRQMRFDLDLEEENIFLSKYNIKRNGQFHYTVFLKEFNDKVWSGDQLTRHYQPLCCIPASKPPGWRPIPIKKRRLALAVQRLRERLINEYGNLRHAFKLYDTDRDSYLTAEQFKRMIVSYVGRFTDDEMYEISSAFDPRMEGKVPYHAFFAQCLRTIC